MAESLSLSPAIAEMNGVLSELDRRERSVDDREAQARIALNNCLAERMDIDAKRKTILRAIDLVTENRTHGPLHGASSLSPGMAVAIRVVAVPVVTAAAPQKRARIGTQRYLMLKCLQQVGRQTVEQIAQFTRLEARRVRSQMVSDAKLGIVSQTFEHRGNGVELGLCFELAAEGADLLNRFETYRIGSNIGLPTLGDMPEESEEDLEDAAQASASEAADENEIPDHIRKHFAADPDFDVDQFTRGITDEH